MIYLLVVLIGLQLATAYLVGGLLFRTRELEQQLRMFRGRTEWWDR